MAATPLGAGDIVGAHLIWILFRTGFAAATVAAVMALFPDVRSWGLLPAVPVAMLLGAAFSMPLGAFTVTRERDMAFPIIQRFVITPLFLFGGAFFPVSQLPPAIRWIAYATPLWHGVELCRALVSGTSLPGPAAVGHLTYLTAFVVVGTVVMRNRMQRKLFA
jgi:lipooligosaccharide transport system permease protein